LLFCAFLIHHSAQQQLSGAGMIPFVVIFLLVGSLLVIGGRKMERQASKTASWKVTDGNLERCEVVQVPGMQVEDPSCWRLQLEYSYVVHGITYRSTRYAFGHGASIDDEKYRRIAAGLKRSPKLSVRYDPMHPAEAVLNTEVPTSVTTLGYFMLVLAGVSALIALGGR
jgi:hypothetical protein